MTRSRQSFVICLRNEGYETSLESRKIYVAIDDRVCGEHGLLKVVDESGDDYLFPAKLFAPIELSPSLKRAVLAAP